MCIDRCRLDAILTKQAYIALKWEANYWRAQHEQSLKREAALKWGV
jgi:hypothetical protein